MFESGIKMFRIHPPPYINDEEKSIMYDLEDLSGDSEELSKVLSIQQKCEQICTFLLDNKATLRMCEEELCIPKSTVHRYIHTYIKQYYDEEFCQIVKLLKFNGDHRRMARRYWKGRPW